MALRALFPSFAFDAGKRGGGGGLNPEFHLMDVNPQTSNQSPLSWDAVIFAWHIIKSGSKWSKYLALTGAFVKSSGNLSPVFCCVSFMVEKLHRTKAESFRHLPDWCIFIDLGELLPWWPTLAHSTIKRGILPGNRHNGGHSNGQIQGDLMVCLCLCPCNNVRGLMPGEPTGGNAAWWWGGGCEAYREREEQLLGVQTCDCCLYLEEQKGIDVVKGRRQSWLKYSVDSCSGGDSAHCGGPACDVSGEGSSGRGKTAWHAFAILHTGSNENNLQ